MSKPNFLNKNKWLIDELSSDLIQIHGIKRVLHSRKTRFQQAEIIDTSTFGICLVLDGKIQSGEKDEFIYHESLVHPALITHPNPVSVFIAGGGEGATLRDVLMHRTVKNVVMVDIDREVVDLCRKHLPTFHAGSFNDKRAHIHYDDARKYIRETEERFDVAIIDLADPVEEGPARLLYTQEFYRLVKNRLKPGGIMAVQSGQSGWINLENFTAINHTLRSIFKIVRPYQVYIPSFVDLWGYHTASDSLDPLKLTAAQINQRIKERINGNLNHYDGISHHALFALSKMLRYKISRARRIITDEKPIFVH
ncbi:MAG: polyamine aminopropyltransferase [Dehalococcoidia bacterium]|nr:polyamine aminopropyltransferase [Dehalococcoidia bacterium]MDD5493765.1 polyamine aminopropyltransferase [Dehalococcoidia bacterium]